MKELLQKIFFSFQFNFIKRISSSFRKFRYIIQGMQIGKNTYLSKIFVTWPHKVLIGNNCLIEQNVYFKYDGIWQKNPSIIIGNYVFIGSSCEFNIKAGIVIGSNSLIASGCRFIDHDHGTSHEKLIREQACLKKNISIGENVWIGCNVIVLKGVTIGDGAIVAAGAVVTKSISANEIWAGIPAKKINDRK